MTLLYNDWPACLVEADRALDAAVAAAYASPADISDDEALGCLLELDQQRSG